MYFRDRADAGRALAGRLQKYRPQHIVVLALGFGSSIVAAQVAMKLHANMLIYVVKSVNLPGEPQAFAGMGSGDTFTYSTFYTSEERDELNTEYHSYIDQERMAKAHELHMLLGEEGEIDKRLLRHRTVILVADGLADGSSLDVAADFLRTVAIKKLVIATPIASLSAVDRMHLVGDEIYCLSVRENYISTNHYYDDNTIPSMESVVKIMRNISINWDRQPAR